jgi:hypothetical protein
MPITYLDEEQPQGKITYLDEPQAEEPQTSGGGVPGAAIGLGALGGAGYGLYKSGIPQFVGRGVRNVAQGFGNLPKVVNPQKGTDFAQTIRKSFVDAHTEKVNAFGNSLDQLAINNPTRSVSLADSVRDIAENWDDFSSSTKSAIKNTPVLNKYLKLDKTGKMTIIGNPGNIDLKSTQEIINHINTKVPANIKANNLDLIDTINNIKGAQLEAFPEMEQVRADYRKFIEPYKNVKQYFKFNKLLNAIKNRFGGAEGQVEVEKILPKEVIKKMTGYRSAAKLAEVPGDIPLVGRMFRSVGGALSVAPNILQGIGNARAMEQAKKTGYFKIDDSGNIIPLSKEDLVI